MEGIIKRLSCYISYLVGPLQGLTTCADPDVRVCCPFLLYLFIDHCSTCPLAFLQPHLCRYLGDARAVVQAVACMSWLSVSIVHFSCSDNLWALGLLTEIQKPQYLSHNGYSPESVTSQIVIFPCHCTRERRSSDVAHTWFQKA